MMICYDMLWYDMLYNWIMLILTDVLLIMLWTVLLLHIMKCEVNYVVRKCKEILFCLFIKYENVYHLVYYLAIHLLKLIYENLAYMAI